MPSDAAAVHHQQKSLEDNKHAWLPVEDDDSVKARLFTEARNLAVCLRVSAKGLTQRARLVSKLEAVAEGLDAYSIDQTHPEHATDEDYRDTPEQLLVSRKSALDELSRLVPTITDWRAFSSEQYSQDQVVAIGRA